MPPTPRSASKRTPRSLDSKENASRSKPGTPSTSSSPLRSPLGGLDNLGRYRTLIKDDLKIVLTRTDVSGNKAKSAPTTPMQKKEAKELVKK